MDISFLRHRKGHTIAAVAAAAGVDKSTAWRWVVKGQDCDSHAALSRLHSHGILTDEDVRAGGMAIALADGIVR